MEFGAGHLLLADEDNDGAADIVQSQTYTGQKQSLTYRLMVISKTIYNLTQLYAYRVVHSKDIVRHRPMITRDFSTSRKCYRDEKLNRRFSWMRQWPYSKSISDEDMRNT